MSPAAGGFAMLLAGLVPAPAPVASSAPAPRQDRAADGARPASRDAASPITAATAAPASAAAATPAAAGPAPGTEPATSATPAPAGQPAASPALATRLQPATPDPQGVPGTPQASLFQGAAAAAAPSSTANGAPAILPEAADPAPETTAVDPRPLSAATRASEATGSAGATPSPGAPTPAAVADSAPPADDPLGSILTQAPDRRGTSAAAKPASAAALTQTAAVQVEAARPAAVAANRLAVTDPRSELSADLGAAAPVRSDAATTSSVTAPQQAGPRAPAMPVAVQLGVQIAAAVPHRIERLFVQLEPPALGRIEVRLEFSRDNRVSATIAADRHNTLDVLQRDSRVLERALQDAGVRLADNGLSFSLRQDQRQQERGAGAPWPQRFDPAASPAAVVPAADDARPVYWFGAQRVLDIRI